MGRSCLSLFFVLLIAAVTAPLVNAQCAQWSPFHPWSLAQSNNITLAFTPTLQGVAQGNGFRSPVSFRSQGRLITGTAEGTIQGSELKMEIFWSNNEVGVYTGKIDASGRVEGDNYVKTRPATHVSWFSKAPLNCVSFEGDLTVEGDQIKKKFEFPGVKASNGETLLLDYCLDSPSKCGDAAANAFCRSKGLDRASFYSVAKMVGRTASVSSGRICTGDQCMSFELLTCVGSVKGTPPPPAPADPSSRPIKKTARAPVKPPAATGAPFIAAQPATMSLPFGQQQGVTNLVWDAGSEHPYAEVWVKIDGGDETFILERGKGTMPYQIIAGRTYLFILTDSGTRLATATVKFSR